MPYQQHLRGTSSRVVLVGICAWISACLLIAGWLPEMSPNVRSLWVISGLIGLISAVGLSETIKVDNRMNELLLNQYMRAAMTDSLTGISNRNSLDNLLQHAIERFRSSSKPFSIAMIDIDHFKLLNDQHGHQAGDAVLRFFAKKMQEYFNGTGIVARYGGEEFCVVLPSCRLRDANFFADDCRRYIKSLQCSCQGKNLQITVSCGTTEFVPTDSPGCLLRRADQALYTAKKMGRDCIWAADPHLLEELTAVSLHGSSAKLSPV